MPASIKDKRFQPLDNFLFLRDISARDRGWDFNRSAANHVTDYYRRTGYKKLADRVSLCARRLTFKLMKEVDGTVELKLKTAFLCHVRLCPICQKARTRAKQFKLFNGLPKLIQENKTMRFLFLTLTVKNCELKDLRNTSKWMSESFTKMLKRKSVNSYISGYIKSLEITKSPTYLAHPHFHVLLAVKSEYFSRGYLSQADWTSLWKDSLKSDYTPIVDIRTIVSDDRNLSDIQRVSNAVKEVAKYMIKPMDLIGKGSKDDCKFFIELSNQIKGIKAFNCSGIFTDYLKDTEPDEEEIFNSHNTEIEDEDQDSELSKLEEIEFYYNNDQCSYVSSN